MAENVFHRFKERILFTLNIFFSKQKFSARKTCAETPAFP